MIERLCPGSIGLANAAIDPIFLPGLVAEAAIALLGLQFAVTQPDAADIACQFAAGVQQRPGMGGGILKNRAPRINQRSSSAMSSDPADFLLSAIPVCSLSSLYSLDFLDSLYPQPGQSWRWSRMIDEFRAVNPDTARTSQRG
jgi:hypothetical protein